MLPGTFYSMLDDVIPQIVRHMEKIGQLLLVREMVNGGTFPAIPWQSQKKWGSN